MRLAVSLKEIPLGIAIVTISFFVSLKTMDWLWPRAAVMAPVLVELPPLPPASRSSSIIAPVAIALSAIRDAADRGAPRHFAGKADNPISQILQNADIGWTALAVTSPLEYSPTLFLGRRPTARRFLDRSPWYSEFRMQKKPSE